MSALIRWSWTLALAGLVLLGGAASAWFVSGSYEGQPTWLALAGLGLVLLWGGIDRDRVGGAVSSRNFLYGSGSGVLVTLALAICSALFLLAETNDHTFDLTTDRKFSLSEHGQKVAAGLESEVTILAFFPHGSGEEIAFQRLVGLFQEHTDKITVQFVDPLREPLLARANEITGEQGTVVLKPASAEPGVESPSRRIEGEVTEDKLASALVLVVSDSQHHICWSLGHGEADPDDEYSERGLGNVRLALEGMNYQVTKTYVAKGGIERECEVLVVARPETDWLPPEREALAAYVAEGGRVLMLLEPGTAPDLADDLARYGIDVRNDVVLDLNPQNQLSMVEDPSFVVLTDRNILQHPLTASIHAAIVLPIARSVGAERGVEGLDTRDLLVTSPDAWGETDPSGGMPQPDEAFERVGEVPVAAVTVVDDPAVLGVAAPKPSSAPAPEPSPEPSPEALPEAPPEGPPGDREIDLDAVPPVDAAPIADSAPAVPTLDASAGVPADFSPKPGGRIVVVGDADFASNTFFVWGNNKDLFLDAVAWLVDEEDQIGERPEEGDRLEITGVGEALLCLVSVVFVPGGAMLLALVSVLRRRFL